MKDQSSSGSGAVKTPQAQGIVLLTDSGTPESYGRTLAAWPDPGSTAQLDQLLARGVHPALCRWRRRLGHGYTWTDPAGDLAELDRQAPSLYIRAGTTPDGALVEWRLQALELAGKLRIWQRGLTDAPPPPESPSESDAPKTGEAEFDWSADWSEAEYFWSSCDSSTELLVASAQQQIPAQWTATTQYRQEPIGRFDHDSLRLRTLDGPCEVQRQLWIGAATQPLTAAPIALNGQGNGAAILLLAGWFNGDPQARLSLSAEERKMLERDPEQDPPAPSVPRPAEQDPQQTLAQLEAAARWLTRIAPPEQLNPEIDNAVSELCEVNMLTPEALLLLCDLGLIAHWTGTWQLATRHDLGRRGTFWVCGFNPAG